MKKKENKDIEVKMSPMLQQKEQKWKNETMRGRRRRDREEQNIER